MRLINPRDTQPGDVADRAGGGGGDRPGGAEPGVVSATRRDGSVLRRPADRRAGNGEDDPLRHWNRLRIAADEARYGPQARVRLISVRPQDPASAAFDLLRTRMVRALQARGWSRVAVTAPSAGCGSSFTAANLAVSLSRLGNLRTLLLDLNLRAPGLARAFDIRNVGALEPVLAGQRAPERHLFRIGANFALGLNDTAAPDAAERLQHPKTWRVLDDLQQRLRPDVSLYDLPPMLNSDDAEAILPKVDGVLLVADGTRTTARQIAECERLLDGQVPLLGVVLNRSGDVPKRRAR